MVLTIEISTNHECKGPPTCDAAAATSQLLERGFDEIELKGLASFGARLRDGKIWDTMPLRTDDDATFLLEAYNALPGILTADRPSNHRVYLWDGCFEINAIILKDRVRVRMGEYKTPFTKDSGEGVSLSETSYRALWASIANALIAGTSRE